MGKKIFAKILLTYACIALVALSLMVPFYSLSLKSSKNVVLQEETRLVSQRYQEMISNLESFRQYAYNLTHQEEVKRLAACTDENKDLAIYMYNTLLMLEKQFSDNPLQCELLITFPKNDIVVTSSRIFADKKIFYETFFSYPQMDLDDWKNHLLSQSSGWEGDVVTNGHFRHNAVTYNYYYDEGAIAVSLIFNTDNLLRQVSSTDFTQSGWLQIQDSRFGTLGEIGTPPRTRDMLIELDSVVSTLAVEGSVPKTMLERNIHPVRSLLFFYFFAAVAIFAVLSILFALSHSLPIAAMLNTLQNFTPAETGKFSPYTNLKSRVDSIAQTYAEVSQERDCINRSYQHILLEMALRGAPVQGDIQKAMEQIPFLRERYIMIALRPAESGEFPVSSLLARLEERFSSSYSMLLKEKCMLMLPFSRDEDGETLIGVIGQCLENLTAGGGNICFGLSTPHCGENELSTAYREAGSRAAYGGGPGACLRPVCPGVGRPAAAVRPDRVLEPDSARGRGRDRRVVCGHEKKRRCFPKRRCGSDELLPYFIYPLRNELSSAENRTA